MTNETKVKVQTMTIRPIHDNVLVKRLAAEKVTPGGIIIPDAARDSKGTDATVVAVGTGKVLANGAVTPMSVRPGDVVVIGKWQGNEVEIDGVKHLVVKDEDVLCVREPS